MMNFGKYCQTPIFIKHNYSLFSLLGLFEMKVKNDTQIKR